ncbi:hypothetical protein JRG66_05770 [Salinimicrobium tongyeongense]|uniref:Uncharacterized protein n=1 Tax=Salinimicrobium tongyeongense TaxID=2809707 RepID=A0ABY6NTY3_9FLAO|nr:hypothetical protein [Salinimicrobium tongyeongense]UZH56370.1 hypothetical protein JRG66_05770 [Salinimicrobium tongyeongense]
MFPVTKADNFNAAVVKVFIEVRRDIDALYFLSHRQKLAKTEFYLLMAEVNIEATTAIALVRGKVI